MSKSMIILFLLIFMCAIPIVGVCQQTTSVPTTPTPPPGVPTAIATPLPLNSINGYVKYNGEKVSGADVYLSKNGLLVYSQNSQKNPQITGVDGAFLFENLGPGIYKIDARKDGNFGQAQITIPDGRISRLTANIELKKNDLSVFSPPAKYTTSSSNFSSAPASPSPIRSIFGCFPAYAALLVTLFIGVSKFKSPNKKR